MNRFACWRWPTFHRECLEVRLVEVAGSAVGQMKMDTGLNKGKMKDSNVKRDVDTSIWSLT